MSDSLKTLDSESEFQEGLLELDSYSVGEDPDNLVDKILGLCKKYLAGIWTDLTVEDIDVKRLTSGMSNQTYYCKIRNSSANDGNEVPEQVVIRMYGFLNQLDYETLELGDHKIDQGLVAQLASELNIGPQIYGLFSAGQIMKYYPNRHLTPADFTDESLMKQLATSLAKFHAMATPLAKERWELGLLVKSFSHRFGQNFDQKRDLLVQNNCKTLLECDMKTETGWLLNMLKTVGSPIVFSHSDFRCGNIFVTEANKIIISDFELSGYYHRGFDMGTFFNGFANFNENMFEFKDESAVKQFIGHYLNECARIYGNHYLDNPINSMEHIIMETKVFMMVNFILYASGLCNNDFMKLPITEKTALNMANIELKKYLQLKRLLHDI